MKRDEHGCLREETEAERDARYAEAEDHPLAFVDIGVRQSLNTAYTAHKELAGFYKSQLAKDLTPQQMEMVEKYAHCEVKAAGSQFLIEKFL